ncbi:MAG TPA: response regulator [Gammaproteobacteria bacterium]|nr:response regulator [Gammaproteobacteria bacterium]HRF43294.1 response regulator [Candidatus Competibacteraceae bacterium]
MADVQAPTRPLRLLLVEDDAGHARLTREWLQEADPFGFAITHVVTLTAALAVLKEQVFDLMALDLGLPDSQGLVTLQKMRAMISDIPIVVLTNQSDESMGIAAVEAGAQDYLVKGHFEPEYLLSRTFKYAVERHQLQQRVNAAREEAEQQRELLELTKRINGHTPVTLSLYSQKALADYNAVLFQTLVNTYRDLLEKAVEQQAFKVEHPVDRGLTALAQQLGFLKAGPRDVIDLHSRALEIALQNRGKYAAKFYADEGRLMALELMGDLVNYYRHFYRNALHSTQTGKEPL